MAKINKTQMGILAVLIIIALILFYFMYTGGFTLQNIFDTDSGDEQLDLPPADNTKDCSDYNIGDEYQQEFGLAIINAGRLACLNAGGEWTDSKNELSCAWPPPVVPFDCSSYEWIDGSKDFCLNDLAAKFYCSSSIAYIGCYCEGYKPSATDYPWYEEEGQDGGDEPGTEDCEKGIVAGTQTGDIGNWCSFYPCSGGGNCDNYWDSSEQIHMCGCTDTFFCQPCYDYALDVNCDCPPGTVKEIFDGPPEGFWCVPDGGC